MFKFFKNWSLYFFILGVAILYSCTYNKKPAPGPQVCLTSADSANISFSKTILPIFQAHCQRCHKVGGQYSNPAAFWDNYTNVYNYADQINEYISGPTPYMPKDGAKVPDCDIIKIQTWIKNGKKDN